MIKGAKSIAEYAIRKWLQEHNFDMRYFTLEMIGNRGYLKDMNDEQMILVYECGEVSVE